MPAFFTESGMSTATLAKSATTFEEDSEMTESEFTTTATEGESTCATTDLSTSAFASKNSKC